MQIRQGEILFIRVEQFSDVEGVYRDCAAIDGVLVVGHSETGHHHVIDVSRSPSAQLLINEANDLMGRLVLGEDAEVRHLRAFDTHAPAKLDAGKYVVRWRREHSPEGIRRVQD